MTPPIRVRRRQPAQTEALFTPKPEPTFGVFVNEIALNTYTAAGVADWWAMHRLLWEASGRLRVLQWCIPGDHLELGPLSRADARFAAAHMVAKGAPKSAVKVRRWTAQPAALAAGLTHHATHGDPT